MILSEITNKEWESLIDCYIKTQAVLESRVIFRGPGILKIAIPTVEQEKWKDYNGPDQVKIFPTTEYFGFRVEGKELRSGSVPDIIGTLTRYNPPNQVTNCGKWVMEWDLKLFSWIIPCENGTWYQTIPGNVLSMTADVLDVVDGKLHPLFEFDHPVAPKGEYRKSILKF